MTEIDLSRQFPKSTTLASADDTSLRFMHGPVTLAISPREAVHYVRNVDKLPGVGFHNHPNGVYLLHGGTHVDLPIAAFDAVVELIESAYLDDASPYKI